MPSDELDETVEQNSIPEWLPDEYDPDAPLRERLPIIADVEGGIELHVRGEGVTEIVGSPSYFDENSRAMELKAGRGEGDMWSWEIVVPTSDDHAPYLNKANPDQDVEAYEATRTTWIRDIDVRIYGVDVSRYDE